MASYEQVPRVAMQLSRDVLVAFIQVDLDEAVLTRFRQDLLDRVHASAPRAVVLEISGVETMDTAEFAALRRVISTVAIMGTQSILVGMQPGVVSALVEMNADVDGLVTAIDIDAAFTMLDEQTARVDEDDAETDESGDDDDTAEPAGNGKDPDDPA